MRYPIDYGLVTRRAKSIYSVYENADCGIYLKKARHSMEKNAPMKMTDIDKFFSECSCITNANRYYVSCLKLIKEETDPKKAKILTENFIDKVLPYIYNTEAVTNAAKTEMLGNSLIGLVESAAKKYSICDNVLKNHNELNEKYDIDHMVQEGRNKGTGRLTLKLCDIISEEAKELTQCCQMDICLDQISYLYQRHKVNYEAADMVKYVTEYFLMKPRQTDMDVVGFKNILMENSSIEDKDLKGVSYFVGVTPYDASKSNINALLNRFISSDNKTLEDFGSLIRTIPLGYMISRRDFCDHFYSVFDFILRYLLKYFDASDICTIMASIPEVIEEQLDNETWGYTREELDQIIYQYQNAIEALEIELADIPEQDMVTKLTTLLSCYRTSVDKICNMRDQLYTAYNIECMTGLTSMVENSHAYYLNEFKIFKFNNLIKAAVEAENFIKGKGKALMDKISGKLRFKKRKKRIKDITVQECITYRDTADICACSFDILSEENFYQVHDIMTSLCKQLNENVLRYADCRAYYMVNPDTVEVHIEDASTILLTDEERDEINETFSVENKERCLELEELANLYESIDIESLNIISHVESKIENIDIERFMGILEASQYVDSFTEEYINDLYSRIDMGYMHHVLLKPYIKSWHHEDAPIEIQVEACNIIASLLESDEEKKKINKKLQEEKDKKKEPEKKEEKVEEKDPKEKKGFLGKKDKGNDSSKEKKNPISGAGLSNLKLYVKGLKTKMKDMNSKEKAWSKDIDMNFNRMYKACKDALISDRREAIIKGSVIPSFSKCIKIGIALAGLTFINPVAAAATAIGGFAMSKNLTRKERLLLLDDIETELEVLDKEIALAERNDNMKKYRQLLKYKKDLQRQYQRIRYNVRIGKDILPGSTTGLKNTD